MDLNPNAVKCCQMDIGTQFYPVRMRFRDRIIGYAISGSFYAVIVGSVPFGILAVSFYLCGDDAWPNALLAMALVSWCLRVLWIYLNQDNRDDG
jgi:hypothetical protein